MGNLMLSSPLTIQRGEEGDLRSRLWGSLAKDREEAPQASEAAS